MAVRSLVLFPDARLRQAAMPVTVFGAELRDLARDILDTMGMVSAIGLTAPHIGVSYRLVVVRLEPDAEVGTYVNPQVAWLSVDLAGHEEGSVSMPGIRETILRPGRVRIAFQDQDGARREIEANGFMAAILQHEIDQLDGIFWIDRLSRLKRDRAVKRFEKVQRLSGR